jgi:NhaC family Na+:H+ antiporter
MKGNKKKGWGISSSAPCKHRNKEPRATFGAALAAMAVLAGVMIMAIVRYGVSPHIPMLIGCGGASVTAAACGFSWEQIQDGMIQGITHALSSVIILILIGVLMGVWIQAGVVPSLVYFGLQMITPGMFLFTSMLLCALVSLALGSWGTIGTIGLALMGVAGAMEIPPPLAAGAIVSGAYLGDKVSPFSDTCNLASAVTEVDIFENVSRNLHIPLTALAISGVGFLILGWQYGAGKNSLEGITALQEELRTAFHIGVPMLFPVLLLVGCIVLRVPTIPSIAAGILAAFVQGMAAQGGGVGSMFLAGMSGFQGTGGVCPMVDSLLTAGGLESMLNSVSMILCAMMFGGVMEATGQIDALMRPLLGRVRSFGSLVAATIGCCVAVNLALPEQYISIVLPGGLFKGEYDRHGVSRRDLAFTLGAGGSGTSALIPWNTCGVFILGVLGVSAGEYLPYALYNLLLPLLALVWAFLPGRRKGCRQTGDGAAPDLVTDAGN